MKDINYAYFSGALESFILSLPFNTEYNEMSVPDKHKYILEHIKQCEDRAIDFNKPL